MKLCCLVNPAIGCECGKEFCMDCWNKHDHEESTCITGKGLKDTNILHCRFSYQPAIPLEYVNVIFPWEKEKE